MNISINKDIEKYQESVVMGLTARQLIFSIASVACGGAIVLLTYRYVGLTGSAYIAIRGGTTCIKRILLISGNEFYTDV